MSKQNMTQSFTPPTPEAIDALTKNQQDVLGWIYTGKDDGHSRQTIASLLKKGWIVEYDDVLPGNPNGTVIERLPLHVKRYTFPSIAHHVAWCEWCSWFCGACDGNGRVLVDDGLEIPHERQCGHCGGTGRNMEPTS